MIAYLKGTLLGFTDRTVLVATSGGVGYEPICPASVLGSLPKKGGEVELFVHTAVSEKAIELYGFGSADELELFRTLISIDKLGPKKAVAILSHFAPDHLREVAWREDANALATVPGIGPKSAKQILWYLKDKVEKMGAAPTSASGKREPFRSEYVDALAGLKNLGYTEEEIRTPLKAAFEDDPDLDAAGAVRSVLKTLAANR